MALIRTSGRALLLALLPAAFLQAVLLALSDWALLAQRLSLTPDSLTGLYALHVGLNAVMLMAGHLMLRHFGTCSRMAYSAMGGSAAAIAYTMALRYGFSLTTAAPGTLVTAGLLPTLAGVLSGFLYGQFAGLEYRGSVEQGAFEQNAFRGRFEGPVHVRTSLGAMGLTAFVPAALIAVLAFATVQIGLSGSGVGTLIFFALPAQVFLTVMFASVVPSAIFILVVHHLARALGFSHGIQYAALGAGTGLVAAVFVFPFSPFLSIVYLVIPSIGFGAIMGALYRRFAGLEPLPLPEPVIVGDVESLVPADDATRKGHSILLNG